MAGQVLQGAAGAGLRPGARTALRLRPEIGRKPNTPGTQRKRLTPPKGIVDAGIEAASAS